MLIKTKDKDGTQVILSKSTWNDKLLHPIFGHPEVKPFLAKIKMAIAEPEYVFQSIRDPRSRLLLSQISYGLYASYYLCVVIKYVKDKDQTLGYISTVMINRKLPKTSKLIWERRALI